MSREFRIALLVLAMAYVVFFIWLPFSPAFRQERNMDTARAFLPTIESQLAGDPRFADVELGVYTGLDGAVWVYGSVEADDDLESLRALIEETNPPRPVQWNVKVYPPLEPSDSR